MVKCKICKSEFESKRALAIHVTKSHVDIGWKFYKRKFENIGSDKFICEICHSYYTTPRGLIVHLNRSENISIDEYIIQYPDIKDQINSYYKIFLRNKYEIDDTTECWNWLGILDRDGYGGFQGLKVHRVFYDMYVGIKSKNSLICHTCDNPKCVNPDHLYEGTHQSNIDDMKNRGRSLTGDRNPAKRKDVRIKISKNNAMLDIKNRDKLSKQMKGRVQPRYNYTIISPDNHEYKINNLFKFCEDMNLKYRSLLETNIYDGWQIINKNVMRE